MTENLLRRGRVDPLRGKDRFLTKGSAAQQQEGILSRALFLSLPGARQGSRSRSDRRKMASASRRVAKELDAIKKLNFRCFRDIQADVTNILLWEGLLMPDNPPYNKGAFWIEISFPYEYPFKPPKIRFKTKIYHPNVDEMGEFCLPIISAENWKAYTRIDQVIQALIELVNNPKKDPPLQPEVAHEFQQDHEKFLLRAEDHTCNFSEKRPCK